MLLDQNEDQMEENENVRQNWSPASEGKEEVLIQPINYSQSDAYRIHWPFLRDRRIDSYHPITKRFLDDES